MFFLLSLALADPADALDPFTRSFFERAEAEAATGRWGQAAAYYRLVLSKDPYFLPASLGLGRTLEGLGQLRQAANLYRSLGNEPDAVEALAHLVEVEDPSQALSLWHRLETLRLGDPIPFCEQARLWAATDAEAALKSWNSCYTLLQDAEPPGVVLLTVSAALIAAENPEGELLLRQYLEAWPEGAAANDVRSRLDRLDVERAAAVLPLSSDEPLTASQMELARRARSALAENKSLEGLSLAEELVVEAPRSAVAHGLLSEAQATLERWGDAEIHALIARNLAPDDADARLRLGLLLEQLYGGRRNAEAAVELREAAALRPESTERRYPLGVVEQSLGNWDAAIDAFEVFLSGEPDGPEAEDAQQRLEALRRNHPAAPPPPPLTTSTLPPEAAVRYRIALELFRRGRVAEGEVELDVALGLAPHAPELLNRKARLLLEAGKEADAVAVWEHSLAQDPNQGAIYLLLGELNIRHGQSDKAEPYLHLASAAGEPDAHYLLARLAAAQGNWDSARQELEAWQLQASSTSPYREAATRLGREARRRYLLLRGSLLGLALVLIGGPLLLWARVRTAQTLRDLLDGAPECWHDAARILAGLRHEVLKHNTTVLPDVAAALERGDRGPWEALSTRTSDLLLRFEEHLGSLEILGSRYGYRLDLHYRDPILGPMFRAMRRLARVRRPNPMELRAISDVINGSGYSAIGRIVKEICVLPVTPEIVRRTYARVCGEPGIVGTEVPPLELKEEGSGLALRMFRNDLEDILANLLRNALSAGASRLMVVLTEDDDPITGVGMVEFRIIDNAPGTLTNAMIRGRYISRGLGLAVDIINRHEGAIRVQQGPEDGLKSVIVQIPRVEAAAVDVEWTV